jgi:SAM-dependent methyltransferase
MGTAAAQGELWGPRARDWAEVQEPRWREIYETFLTHVKIGRGTKLLDVGCGAGGALKVARERGADISGLDASISLATIARERLSGARIEVGEMEELPFDDASFDFVIGCNSFQFAADMVAAFKEAARVCRSGGNVAAMFWGRREDCELVSGVLPAILQLLPPSPTPAPTPFDFGVPGVVEGLMGKAGLAPEQSGEIDGTFYYPDAATAIRAHSSAGPSTRAIIHSGEAALKDALANALVRFTRPDGSVELKNRFRWVAARRE